MTSIFHFFNPHLNHFKNKFRNFLLVSLVVLTSAISFQSVAFADCADGTAFCFAGLDDLGQPIGNQFGDISYGKCWSWLALGCVICDGEQYKLRAKCRAKFPQCGPHCAACTSVNVIGSIDPTICY